MVNFQKAAELATELADVIEDIVQEEELSDFVMQLALRVLAGEDRAAAYLEIYKETYGEDPDENPFEDDDDDATD